MVQNERNETILHHFIDGLDLVPMTGGNDAREGLVIVPVPFALRRKNNSHDRDAWREIINLEPAEK